MTRSIEEGALGGSFVMRHREILRQRLGADRLTAVLGALEPEARDAILGARTDSWVPIVDVEALYRETGRALGRDPVELHIEIATQVAEQLVRTVWRILIGLATDSALVARATVFYAKGYNRGTLTARLVGPGRAEALLAGWPDAPDFTLRGVRIALDTVLRLAGRKAVVVVAERQPQGARWHMSWQT